MTGLIHSAFVVLALGAMPFGGPTDVRIGSAAHYSIGVMEHVADVRGMERVPCMASSPFYPLGTWLRVERLATGMMEVCRVTDQSATKDRSRHIRHNLVVELGWPAARRLCGLKRVNQEPPWKCQVRVTKVR